MSKKRQPEAAPLTGGALIVERIEREREWAWTLWMQRMTFAQISALSVLPVSDGGIGVHVSRDACRNMVSTYREEHGDVTLSRDERIERQSDEIDDRARRARFDLEQAHRMVWTNKPNRDDFESTGEYLLALTDWTKAREAAAKIVESADRRLAAAQKDERDTHGLNAAQRIEADVTHHDGATAELFAMLDEAGVKYDREKAKS